MSELFDDTGLLIPVMMISVVVVSAGAFWRGFWLWRAWRRLTQAVSVQDASPVCSGVKPSARRPSVDLPALIRQVAASLEAGLPVDKAWAAGIQETGGHYVFGHRKRPGPVLCGKKTLKKQGFRYRTESGGTTGWNHSELRSTNPNQIGPDGVVSFVADLAKRPSWAEWWANRRRPFVGPTFLEVLGRNSPERARLRQAADNVQVACRFTQASGAPLAVILHTVAQGMDRQTEVDRARKIARAGPSMSARVLVFLPLLGVGLAAIMGAKPFELFSDGGIGTACLVVGLFFEIAGMAVTWWMIRASSRLPEGPDVALWCDLARTGVAAGASIPDVLGRLGQAAREPALEHFGRCMMLGVPWGQAWGQCFSEEQAQALQPLARPLRSAWEQGLAPEVLLSSGAASIRQSEMVQARQSAEVLAVRLVIPVASCLLPAFLFLGVIPLLVRFLGASITGLT